MNTAEKQAWIDDLKSGKYKHGKLRLKKIIDGETYHCCLGVLCETLGVKILPMVVDHGDEHKNISTTEFNRVEVAGKSMGYEFFEKQLGFDPCELYSLNDRDATVGFYRQIEFIERHVIPNDSN